MLRKCKYFLLSFIFLISSFLPCMYSFAQGTEWTSSEKTKFFAEGFYKIVTDICGLILPTGLGGQNLQADYQTYVLNNDWIQSNMTYDEWIASQISGAYINGSSGDSDITFSADLQNSLKQWAKGYVSNEGYFYAYSLTPDVFLTLFANQEDYHIFKDFLIEHDSEIKLITITPSLNQWGVSLRILKSEYQNDFNFYTREPNPNLNNNVVNVACAVVWDEVTGISTYFSGYRQSLNNHNFVSEGGSFDQLPKLFVNENSFGTSNGYNYFIIDNTQKQYLVYKGLNNLKLATEGVQSYYVTDSYNNINNSVTDSYNTTTSNINNSITYGDVQNYVNNYYVENNSYPTTNTVNQYITNYVPPENGGSGGDNGGGGSNIFDFLGTIGDFLGNLIQGIGNVISGILSALTDVIDMFIGENGLPNVIGQLISYFLPFLPEWVPTVIGLSVTLALLIGIVKLIRGS